MSSDISLRAEAICPDGSKRSTTVHDVTTTRDVCQMLSEWCKAPLNRFCLYTVPLLPPTMDPFPDSIDCYPPPTLGCCLEDDRLLEVVVANISSPPSQLAYKCRVFTPTLFKKGDLKGRYGTFLAAQCRDMLQYQSFDTFFTPKDLSHLIALSLLLKSHPSGSVTTPPDPSTLISPLAFKRQSKDSWDEMIQEELTSLNTDISGSYKEKSLESLQTEFSSKCIDNYYFGMEVWAATACDCMFDRYTSKDGQSPVMYNIHDQEKLEDRSNIFDIPEDTNLHLGVNSNGIHIMTSKGIILTWDLYSVKCWSYSKSILSWNELESGIEYSVKTTDGYYISGLLMDYALAIVAERGKEPVCLKFQNLQDQGWKGKTVILDEGKQKVNSMTIKAKNRRDPFKPKKAPPAPKTKQRRSSSYDPEEDSLRRPSTPYSIRKTTTSITISWDAPPEKDNITRFEVIFGVRFTLGWNKAPSVANNSSAPMCTITGLEKGTQYVFMCRAMNDRGFWSDWSETSEPVRTKDVDSPDPTHLVVLSHGIAANEKCMSYIETRLQDHYGSSILVLNSIANASFGCTKDGINIGGHRLALEIVDCIKRNPDLCKISMIGHNTGGLYCRYAAGALYANDMFRMIKPVNFITLATPHLGSGGTILSDDMASILCGETGQQLAMCDGGLDSEGAKRPQAAEEPMMVKICHRQFLQALLFFPNRLLYTNIVHDGRVNLCSGSIRKADIYRNVTNAYLEAMFLKNYPGIIAADPSGNPSPTNNWKIDDEDDDDAAQEDEFISLDSPPRTAHQNRGKGDASDPGSMTSPSTIALGGDKSSFRRDIYNALNDIGWRRIDVIGYGHDQILEQAAWWWGGGKTRNKVVDHLVDNFMLVRDKEEEGVDGKHSNPTRKSTAGTIDFMEGLQATDLSRSPSSQSLKAQSNQGNLEMHDETSLYFFR